MYKCKYFKIQELVSKMVYDRFGLNAWRFFDENILKDLDIIREYHGLPITINNWASGGSNSQCGLRSNRDSLVANKKTLYCSAHTMGKAFDLHSANIKKLYADVEKLYKLGQLRAIKRLESPKSTQYAWCHIDSFQTTAGLEYFIA